MRPTYQRLPTLDAWNVTVQRQVTKNTSLEIGYVANKGTHGFAGNGPAYDLNPAALGGGTAIVTGKLANGNAAPNGTSCSAAGVSCSVAFTPSTPFDQRRPFFNKFTFTGTDPSTGKPVTIQCCADGIMGNFFGNDANSHYNSLQAKVDHRFSQGLQFQANYTFSHAFNYSNDYTDLYATNRKLTYGRDDFNRNHVFLLNLVYDLPFGRGKTFAGNVSRAFDYVIGGWEISNQTMWASGLPWTPSLSSCGDIHDTGSCHPDLKGSFNVGAGSFDPVNHVVQFFTPVAPIPFSTSSLTVGQDTCAASRPTSGPFSLPACGTDGNVGRNTFTGPRHFSSDAAISKSFKVTERVNAQFRMDAYNVFNHPVYAFSSTQGNTCIDCGGNAGQITDIENNFNGSGMRQLQFGLKVSF
jgi:hypothetical protein